MKIDKQKLIELLIEKTEMSREEIENQLDQLIERILDAAKRGKALEIKEFGLFYFDEEGELKFEAAQELSTEISFKYAGMKPVELKPAKTYEPEEVEEDEIEDEIEGDEDDLQSEPPSDAETEEMTVEEDDEDEIELFVEEEYEPEPEPEPEKPDTKSRTAVPSSVRRKKDNTGIYVLAAIVLVAVAIGGYFYFTQSGQGSASEQMDNNVVMQEPEPLGMANGEMSEPADDAQESIAEDGSEDMQNGQAAVDETDAESGGEPADENLSGTGTAAEDQPLYGLRGSVVEDANNGYSIVLHSFTDETNARNTASRLRNDNYRVIIVPRNVQGQTVWRVSVGQFVSLEDAREATAQLPAPYNQRNFIHRIQIN